VYKNRWHAPGGRYKTTTGEWAYIAHGSNAPYIPPTIKRGRPLEDLPEDYFADLPYSIQELCSLFRRGRRKGDEIQMYDDLARYVVEMPCPTAALARELECSPRSIDRLKERGMTLLEAMNEMKPLLTEVNERLGLVLGLNEAHLEAEELLADSEEDAA
jgi:hypothetical protein